jgi:hypothetical protein
MKGTTRVFREACRSNFFLFDLIEMIHVPLAYIRRSIMKLNVKALAIAVGLFWGFTIFLITWWIMLFEGATGDATFIGLVYRGYCISPLGSIIGLLWGLVDGAIGGAIFGWLYNLIAARG